ncbi:hypothetical protein [Streptomyces lydicus]
MSTGSRTGAPLAGACATHSGRSDGSLSRRALGGGDATRYAPAAA